VPTITTISARIRPDRTVVEILDDGDERPFPKTGMPPMTEAEVSAAAAADPDARPMTPEQLATAKRIPRIKTLRRALGLTQEEFAARYHIPVGTLRDWEQGRYEPDQTARAYLAVIASDPEGVSRLNLRADEERATGYLNLTDDELVAVTAAIRGVIEGDRFPHAPRPSGSAVRRKEDQTNDQARS
jgi:putative transcriptional regulator